MASLVRYCSSFGTGIGIGSVPFGLGRLASSLSRGSGVVVAAEDRGVEFALVAVLGVVGAVKSYVPGTRCRFTAIRRFLLLDMLQLCMESLKRGRKIVYRGSYLRSLHLPQQWSSL